LSIGTLLTAFYMTRQVCYVFFGSYRGAVVPSVPLGSSLAVDEQSLSPSEKAGVPEVETSGHPVHARPVTPHESPPVMTWPLIILAVGSILVGFVGTPFWPWFHAFMEGHHAHFSATIPVQVLVIMLFSTVLVTLGIGAGWWLYGRQPTETAEQRDPIEVWNAGLFAVLRQRFLVDELYDASIVVFHRWLAWLSDWFDRLIWANVVRIISLIVLGLSLLDRLIDDLLINLGFNEGSESLRRSARYLSRFQNGQVHRYLRVLGLSITVLAFFFLWGCRP